MRCNEPTLRLSISECSCTKSHTGHIDVAIGYLSGGYREQVLASSYTIGVGLRANNMSPISSSLRVTSYKYDCMYRLESM